MTAPMVFVVGLGRCGTSMTMQMLEAGGMKCAGSFPDFEPGWTRDMQGARARLHAHAGCAVKWLNPHSNTLHHDRPAVVLLLTRDHREQARSQCKLLGQSPNRDGIRRLARVLYKDEMATNRAVQRWPVLMLSFEGILSEPVKQSAQIARFIQIHGGPRLRILEMSLAVQSRGSACAPDRSLEMRLLQQSAG